MKKIRLFVPFFGFLICAMTTTFAQIQNYYGINTNGGASGLGTIYTGKTDGTGFNVLYTFISTTTGYQPKGVLALGPDSAWYGTCPQGGTSNNGTIFKITSNGTFTKVWDFQGGVNGYSPQSGLITGKDGNLYGICSGSTSSGVLFRFSTNGSFTPVVGIQSDIGNGFYGQLVEADSGVFYGLSIIGGIYGNGSAFKIDLVGNLPIVTKIYDFNSSITGGSLYGKVTFGNGNEMFGLCNTGGAFGGGTMFKLTTTGSFTKLYDFNKTSPSGYAPYGSLVLATNGNLYGTCNNGGTFNNGMIFKFNPNSNTFTDVRNLNPPNDGASIVGGGLVQSAEGSIFGLVQGAGTYGNGGIFKITTQDTYSIIRNFNPSSDGNGTSFNGLILSKLKQTLGGLNIPAEIVLGTSPMVLSTVTASSGLPVSFSSSNPSVASISGNNLIFLTTGTTNISAFQRGNSNYYPAISLSKTVVVKNFTTDLDIYSQTPWMQLYPNPSTGDITVTCPFPATVEIRDVLGIKLKEFQIEGEQQLTDLKKGIYVIRFSDNQKQFMTQKLIVE